MGDERELKYMIRELESVKAKLYQRIGGRDEVPECETLRWVIGRLRDIEHEIFDAEMRAINARQDERNQQWKNEVTRGFSFGV